MMGNDATIQPPIHQTELKELATFDSAFLYF